MKRFPETVKRGAALLLTLLLAATVTLTGCSSDSYDEPRVSLGNAPLEGYATNVVIDAATLKAWMDAGLVNAEDSFGGKVVILDVSNADAYNTGHIPGAQLWTNSGIERYEGPVLSSNMVLDGATMDSYLQQYGIDENTTVVFAGGSNPARIYFMFRYWGFSKSCLKILNGNKAAWTAAGYELTSVTPNVTPSTFSVRDLQINPDVRASLNEFIVGVENGTAVPLNTLTNNTEKAGGTTGIFPESGDFVIFQGSVQGAKHLGQANLYNDDGTVKSAEEIKALLSPEIDGSKPIIAYCRAGNAASNGFMPIDVALDWDVMVYDGSWSQWGSLTNQTGATFVPDASYALPAVLSAWATDSLISWHTLANDDYLTPALQIPGPYYNINFPKTIEKPTFRIMEGMLTPYDAGANSIEIEDRDYSETPPAGGAPTEISGGGGGGC